LTIIGIHYLHSVLTAAALTLLRRIVQFIWSRKSSRHRQ